MDVQQIAYLLADLGKRCLDLADELTDKGRSLTDDESNLIRIAMLPAINEEHELAICRFLSGKLMRPDYSFTEF